MKTIYYTFFVAAICAVSCSKKSDNSGPVDPPLEAKSPVISSVRVYDSTTHRATIDSFEYDEKSRLTKYLLFFIEPDSSVDSKPGVITFNYDGDDSLPTTAVFNSSVSFFSYDNRGRMIMDSVSNGEASHLSYGANEIYISKTPKPFPGDGLDTFWLQNNNLKEADYWYAQSAYEFQHAEYKFDYSIVDNPLYRFHALGFFLYMQRGRDLDYISAKLPLFELRESLEVVATWVSTDGIPISGVKTFVTDGVRHTDNYDFKYL